MFPGPKTPPRIYLVYRQLVGLELPRSVSNISQSIPVPLLKNSYRDFPGDPVAKTLCSHGGGLGSIPGQGTEIPHVPCMLSHHSERSGFVPCSVAGTHNGIWPSCLMTKTNSAAGPGKKDFPLCLSSYGSFVVVD